MYVTKLLQVMSPQHTTNELIAGVEYPAEVCCLIFFFLNNVSPLVCICKVTHVANRLILPIWMFCLQYLGSTPIFLSGVASAKSSRMYQAQQAVKLIKVQSWYM